MSNTIYNVPKGNRIWLRLRREMSGILQLSRPHFLFWTLSAHLLPDFTLPGLRRRYYQYAGCKVDGSVSLLGCIALIGEGNIAPRLTIGEGSVVAPHVTFGLDAPITIGENVSISPHATLYTATHAIGFGSRRMSLIVTPKPIVVEDGVWIGMHSLILPGVTLGQGCVVSAGSVVTQDVPPNTLVAGNPAIVQQKLPFGNR